MKRKVTALLLALLMAFSFGSFTVLAATDSEVPVRMTFEEYVLFLEEMANAEAFSANIYDEENLVTARSVLDAIHQLSADERTEFMSRLHDPSSWDVSYSNVVTSIRPVGNDYVAIQPLWTDGQHLIVQNHADRDMTVFGIPLVRIRQDISYTFFWNVRIDQIVRYNPHVVHNFSPLSSFGPPVPFSSIVANQVRASFTMSFRFGPIYDVSIQTGTLRGSMIGDVRGNIWVSWG